MRSPPWGALAMLAWGRTSLLLAQSHDGFQRTADSTADSVIAQYRADYAVPDAPALTLLDLEGSDLVRPTTARDLAVSFSDFVGSGGEFRIPRTLAVEVSPGLLFFGKDLTLARYRKAPVLYRLRVSVAARRQENSATASSIAFAIRTSPIDAADLRTNGFMQSTVAPIALAVARIDSVAEARADQRRLAIRDSLRAEGVDAAEIRRFVRDSVPRAIYQASEQGIIDSMVGQFTEAADSARDASWSGSSLDLAVGLRLDARDSTGADLRAGQIAAWLTYTGSVGHWAQWVVGAKMASDRDSVSNKYALEGSIAARWYAGSNKYKVYVDFQGEKRGDADAEWRLASGAEIGIFKSVWADASLGGGWGPDQGDGRIRLKLGLKSAFARN